MATTILQPYWEEGYGFYSNETDIANRGRAFDARTQWPGGCLAQGDYDPITFHAVTEES